MHHKLINYFLKITNLSAAETDVLVESMQIKEFAKGSFLIREGQYGSDTFFVLDGLVRQFILHNGNEISTNFFAEEQWIISLENFAEKSPSMHNLVCVEDTTVVVGNEQKAQELFKQFPHFETVSRQIMENAFLEHQKQMNAYVADKPEQRYLTLLENRPDLFQRIPQYDIASYIGVKPESLSRIRKKLLGKD